MPLCEEVTAAAILRMPMPPFMKEYFQRISNANFLALPLSSGAVAK
ncbi:hypothetical protein SD77_0809 [Bacillus badius]|uniref:Uncharacterized protein n=1 Tax=Bacillus badius TaxID=1455 RepID=A0ABR5ATZ0_BACBA|nr:hypothetical protein SD78_3944 [Bacillus badius]KIL78208.1 hypothetical protein SD77_0809 [Bacillus badius]